MPQVNVCESCSKEIDLKSEKFIRRGGEKQPLFYHLECWQQLNQ